MQLRTFGNWTGSVSGIGAGALTASPEYQFLAPYLALASAAVWTAMLLWFLFSNRREIRSGVTKLGSWYFIVPCLALGILSIAGAAYGLGLRASSTAGAAKEVSQPGAISQALPPPQSAPGSVLVGSRYYSAKNKEEVAELLDKISGSINKTGDEILRLAEVSINQSPWDRPGEDIAPFVQQMDKISTLTIKMHIALYDELLANGREYRVEVNSILFPKEPFTNFQIAANEFREGLSVWMKVRDTTDNESRQGLLRLVHASRMTFATARQNFVNWLLQRQELIDQTRRGLRS